MASSSDFLKKSWFLTLQLYALACRWHEGQLTDAMEDRRGQGIFQKSPLTGWRFFLVQEQK